MIVPPLHGSQEAETARTRIKICGVTHPADAELAISLGADALGLNFFPGSPRFLSLADDLGWLRALAGAVPRVAVLVNPARAQIDALMAQGIVDAVQLHGDEDEFFCRSLHEAGIPFAKALRVRDEGSLRQPERFHTDWLLLDAYHPGAYGGTGQTMDWTLATRFATAGASAGRRTILSGGLHPGNVAEAIHRVRPYAVDVASGVETENDRRRKDAARLRDFFMAVRAADESGISSLNEAVRENDPF